MGSLVEMELSAYKKKRTDGQTDRLIPIYPPKTLFARDINMKKCLVC